MPTTTTGIATEFITFSRPGATQGGATVTDSDGLVKWAPHNLLLNSESFDTTSWTKTTTTVAANSIAAPNGTTTADTLTATGANSTTLQSYTALAVPYTFGVWLRRKTGTGDIQIAADSGTYTTVTITSSWALYTVSQTPAAGTISAGIRIVTSADEVYAWGAALYRSDLSMQPNTSAYPMYNPTTAKNLLGYTEDFGNAAWTKTRVLAFGSGSVANAIVAPNGLQTADLVVPNTVSGTHAVDQLITVVSTTPYRSSIYVRAAGYSKIGLYDNGGADRWSTFNLSGSGSVIANGASATGAITALPDGWYRISLANNAGSSSYNLIVYLLDNAYSSGSPISYTYTGDGTSGIYLWGAQLSDSGSLDPYFPSYSTAPTAAAYYGPRRDFDGTTLACKGLLVEEQRANVFRYTDRLEVSRSLAVTGVTGTFTNGETVTATGGGTGTYILSGSSSSTILVKGGSGTFSGILTGGTSVATATISSSSDVWELFDTTISENTVLSPDGTTNADKIVETATTANHLAREVISNANAAYTFSIFLKAAERTRAFVGMSDLTTGGASIGIDLSTGLTFPTGLSVGSWTSISSSVVPYSNSWYRVTISGTRGAGTAVGASVTLVSTGTTTNYLGVVGSGLYAYGGQLETGSFATSYIPTTTASATRTADVASVATQAFPYSATEGTLVAAYQLLSNTGSLKRVFDLYDTTKGNYVNIIALNGINTSSAPIYAEVVDGSSSQASFNLGTPAAGINKGALAWAANNFGAAQNGIAQTPDTTGTVPTANNLRIGAHADSTVLNGWIRQITYLPRRIPEAELQTRTTL